MLIKQSIGGCPEYLNKSASSTRVMLGLSILTSLLAFDVAAARAEIEQVTVSARKREETSQGVPAQVLAVSGDTLQKFSVTRIDDLAAVAPQLQLHRSPSGSGSGISLRGIGGTSSSLGIVSPVSINVDGAYYGRGRVIEEGLFDVSSVEVLKGPQALFFGKNATAGAIAIKTNDPGDDFEAMARIGYEVKTQRLAEEGFISGPVNDKIGLRLAVRFSNMFGGYVKNTYVPGSYTTFDYATGALTTHMADAPQNRNWPGGGDQFTRLTAKFTPSDEFTFTLKANIKHSNNTGTTNTSEVFFCPTGVSQSLPGGEDCKGNWKHGDAPLPPDMAAVNPLYDNKNGQLFDDYLSYGITGTAEYTTDVISVTSVLNYQWYEVNLAADGGLVGGTNVWYAEAHDYRAFSGETRALTSFDGSFNFMLGAYYQSQGLNFAQDIIFAGVEDSSAPNPKDRYIAYAKTSHSDGNTFAVFGQAIWNITPDLELAGGARYTHETYNSNFTQPFVNPLLQGIFVQGRNVDSDQTFNDVSPEATLTWKPSSDLTFYAAYKQGFKSGGFSNGGIDGVSSVASDFDFDPETVKGFEGGVKANFLDGSLHVELAGFHYTYNNLQVDFFNSSTFAYITTNAGTSKQDGAEFQFQWSPPSVDGLNLFGSLAYIHTRYGRFPDAACYSGQTIAMGCNIIHDVANNRDIPLQDISGKPTMNAPKVVASLGVDYSMAISNDLILGFTVNGRFSTKYYSDAFSNPFATHGAYALLDASIRIGAQSDRWEFAIIGRNLTNEYLWFGSQDTPLTGTSPGGTTGILGDQAGSVNAPRTVEFQLTLRF